MSLLRHLVVLLLLFPPVAFANSTGWNFINTGGTMSFDPTTDTLTLTSTITTIFGYGSFFVPIVETGSDLGTITVTTGPLISGSILHQAVFDGGTITLTVDVGFSSGGGTLVPFTLLGTLNAPLNWYVDNLGRAHLSGVPGEVGSALINGVGITDGVNILDFRQMAVSSGTNQYNVIEGGTTIPEPGTVVLVVTGLGFLGCRIKSRPIRA
jgi:hypothetical protein